MARKKLGGSNDRNDTPEDKQKMLDRVYELTVQTPKLKKSEIARLINRSEVSVWNYWQELIKQGRLTATATGRPQRPEAAIRQADFEELNATDFVSQNPSIQNWKTKMERGGKKGKGVKNLKQMITQLYVVCRTLQVNPDAFLISSTQTIELMEQFKTKFLNGEAQYISKIEGSTMGSYNILKSGQDTSMRHYAVAVANFCARNDKPLPKGLEGALSRKKDNFGSYATVKLSDKEVFGAIEFMKNHKEGGEEWAALVALHHEMITRSDTIANWKVNLLFKEIVIDGVVCKFAEAPQVYEEKTHKSFDKIIINPLALEYARKLQQGKPIIKSETSTHALLLKYNRLLREYYASIGRIDPQAITNHNFYKKVKDGDRYYLAYNPNYTMRHSGCHMWSRRCDYNVTYVMSLGWDDPSMVIHVYGKMPNEQRLRGNACMYCRPPHGEGETKIETDDMFCSWNHALVYYNNGGISQKQMFEERAIAKKQNMVPQDSTGEMKSSTGQDFSLMEQAEFKKEEIQE